MTTWQAQMRKAIENRNWSQYEELVHVAYDAHLRRKDEAYQRRKRAKGQPVTTRKLAHWEVSPWWNLATGSDMANKIDALEELGMVDKFIDGIANKLGVPPEPLS